MTDAPPSSLRNLGEKSDGYFAQVGIHTAAQIKELGPVEAFLRVAEQIPHYRNRMALYAIYGGLTDQDCTKQPDETKKWLEEQLMLRDYPDCFKSPS